LEERPQGKARWRQASVDEDGLAGRQLAKPARRRERLDSGGLGARAPPVVADRPRMLRSLLFAKQPAHVLQGDWIRDSRADDLGAVIVHDSCPSTPVARLDLRQVLPDRDQLDTVPGGGGDNAVQVREWSDARCLVEHDQKRWVEWPASSGGLFERGIQDLAHDRGEHGG